VANVHKSSLQRHGMAKKQKTINRQALKTIIALLLP